MYNVCAYITLYIYIYTHAYICILYISCMGTAPGPRDKGKAIVSLFCVCLFVLFINLSIISI